MQCADSYQAAPPDHRPLAGVAPDRTTGQDSRVGRLVITGASEPYFVSLLALIGSLRINWPSHPPLLVYDLGLEPASLARLEAMGQRVRKVEPFCPHWRHHFAWKIWCWNDAPAEEILWIDAGIAVLEPLDEVFDHVSRVGYFVVPTYHTLDENASESACEGCRVPPRFRHGRATFAGGFIGFRKRDRVEAILREALEIAKIERFIASSERQHRHDQMLIALLLHRDLGPVCPADGQIYAGWISPDQVPGQRVWVHRRRMRREDMERLASAAQTGGSPFRPQAPPRAGVARRIWKAVFGPIERTLRRVVRGESILDRRPYDGFRRR
jgi:hypothetical protein